MGEGRGNTREDNRFRIELKSEQGYLLISTLFFLVFSGLFAGSMIRISGTQILQYNQLTTAYEAKATLNMSETLLLEHLEHHEMPRTGKIDTSAGVVMITRVDQIEGGLYQLKLTTKKGLQFTKELWVPFSPQPAVEGEGETEETVEPEVMTEPEEDTEPADVNLN